MSCDHERCPTPLLRSQINFCQGIKNILASADPRSLTVCECTGVFSSFLSMVYEGMGNSRESYDHDILVRTRALFYDAKYVYISYVRKRYNLPSTAAALHVRRNASFLEKNSDYYTTAHVCYYRIVKKDGRKNVHTRVM